MKRFQIIYRKHIGHLWFKRYAEFYYTVVAGELVSDDGTKSMYAAISEGSISAPNIGYVNCNDYNKVYDDLSPINSVVRHLAMDIARQLDVPTYISILEDRT